jgi:hypothetical protein
MEINLKKTQIMIFEKEKQEKQDQFLILEIGT